MPGSCTSRATSSASSARICSATRSGREPWDISREPWRGALRGDRHPLLEEHFDHVADLDVVELLEADAAFETRLHLARVVLEAPERADFSGVHHDVVAQQARLRVARARDPSLGDHAPGNRSV